MNKTIDNLEQLKQVKAEDQDKTIIQSDIKDLEEKIQEAERDLQNASSAYDELKNKKEEAENKDINESVDLDTASKGLEETTFELSLIDQEQKKINRVC